MKNFDENNLLIFLKVLSKYDLKPWSPSRCVIPFVLLMRVLVDLYDIDESEGYLTNEEIVRFLMSLKSHSDARAVLGVLSGKQPAFITRRNLVELNEELQRRLESGEGGYLYQLKVEATAALSIMHMIELIETQGPETLEAFIEKSLKRMAFEEAKATSQ